MCTVMTKLLPFDYMYLSLTLQVSEGLVYVYDPPLHSRGNFLDYYVELDRRLLDYIVGLDTEINELVTGSVCDLVLVQCIYRSVPLIRPPILYTTSSPKRGGGVFSSTQLVSIIIRPSKSFATFTCMTLPRFMFTVTKVQTIASTVRGHHAWSIGDKSCHFNSRAITFTTPSLWPSSRTAILSVMNHGTFPGISCRRVAAR